MDERSFQELPPVFSSHYNPFKAPAVVREKIYTPLALEALFHNANANLHIYLENSPSVPAESAVSLTCVSRFGGNTSVALQFLFRNQPSGGFPGGL